MKKNEAKIIISATGIASLAIIAIACLVSHHDHVIITTLTTLIASITGYRLGKTTH